ncbi:Aste57867_12073 [Symbiodinium microadriaticum]|nr:Aste57867_12073 [Symbiodinium microadriaticum]
MGGIDDDGHTGGDDSFVSTGTESDLSPMKSARQGSGSPFSRPNVGAVTGHGQRETEEEVYQSCEHGSGETITQLHFDSYSPLASDQERITETSFLWGWLSCTALLARNTPTSFKVAMGRVEDWAAVAAKAELLAQRTLEESTCERGGGVGEQSLADHKAGYEDSEESEGERVDVDMDSTEADMAGLVAPYEDSVEMAYHEESVRRAREREGTDEDEVEDLLGDSKAMNSATQTLSGWSRGLTAGISVMANMALPANTVAGGKQHKSAVQLEAASKALQVSLRYPLHGRADRACLFTTADEVLPCVCSPRRRSDMSSSMAFQTTFVRNASVEGRAERPFPCPLTDKLAVDESPFFFAIDCWPEDMTMTGANALSSRLFRIPKALQLPYTTVMDAMAMDEMLQVLEPLSQSVHFVLIGKGLDIIRFQHNLKCDGPLDVCQAGEDAQLAAMAMALMKRGFPHVSLLEGGAGELLRFLWRCEGRTVESSHNSDNCTGSELGLHALVDVDHDEIDRLFAYLTGTQPPHEQSSTSTSLANKITTASVTDMLSSSMNTTYNLFRRR